MVEFVESRVLDSISAAVVATDREGIVTVWNAAATELYGWPAAEALGRSIGGLLVPGDAQDHGRSIAARVMVDGSWSGEFDCRTRAGCLIPVAVDLHRLLDGDGLPDGVVGVSRDLTELRASETRIRLLEAQRRAIFTRSYDLTLFFEADGTIAWASPSSASLIGVPPELLVGVNGLDLVHPDDRPRVIDEFFASTIAPDAYVRTRFRIVDAEGRVRWVEEVATNLIDDPDVGYVVGNIRDITEQHLAAEALGASEARYRSIVETAQEGIWVTDADGRTQIANRSMAAMLGVDLDGLDRLSMHDFLAPGSQAPAPQGGPVARVETRFIRADGSELWAIVSTTPFVDSVGATAGTLRMVTDITDRKRMEEGLGHLAHHDPLTGLPNRTLLIDRLEQSLRRRDPGLTAVLFLDLDNFKDVNDSFGHSAGDGLLGEVARRLRAAARDADTVGRFGGDELVVICDRVADADEAVGIAERLASCLRDPFKIEGSEVFMTASIGVAVTPPSDATLLFRRADGAMYRAKGQGRSRITLFDAAVETENSSRIQMQAEMRHALENDEFAVWYQPIVDIESGSVAGVEALIRWHHPTRGLVLPASFIDVAERSGAIRDIGAFVLTRACTAAAAWLREGRRLAVSVNVAASQLADERFATWVEGTLTRSGLPADMLTCEVTERAAMHDHVAAVQALLDLRALGVHTSLDDFGTGYSSLSFLKALPVDAVKIDRSFVEGLGRDRGDTQIVAGVVSMARALGHTVVAEGVETTEQLDELRTLGCRYGQGYLWSPAVPEGDVAEIVARIDREAQRLRI